jgi:MoaA/NifB/PqqE/SkfB family radical SAM enzyme
MVYQENPPFIAEIIMNSYCPNRCRHCIYPANYHLHNKNMSLDMWMDAFEIVHNDLGLKTFIFDGRALTRECTEAICFIKERFKGSRVGLLTDGISAEPFLGELIAIAPDWVDISVDGLEKDHDTQRNSKGAFRKTLRVLRGLKGSGRFEKVNILSCLTTINIGSILEMIGLLNREGFKNFFITPVNMIEGYWPDPELRPRDEAFVDFIDSLLNRAGEFTDTWLELDIYDAAYANAIRRNRPELFEELAMEGEHLELVRMYGDNEFHICYYPNSLLGTREFILNPDGNIIPKVMTTDARPKSLTFGNILDCKADRSMFKALTEKPGFPVYLQDLLQEKALLR